MTEDSFKKHIDDIKKLPSVKINPNVHELSKTMCFKTWNDVIISLPNRQVKWCCKTHHNKEDTEATSFDLDTLEHGGVDFLFNHPNLQKRKYELSGGTKSKECNGCWKAEEAGSSSVRTDYNSHFEPLWKNRFEIAKKHPKKAIQFHQEVQQHDGFRFIEIELTNKCNMACSYCWEGLSSRWQKEVGRRFPDTDDAIFDKVIELLNEYWDNNLNKQNYVNFSLLGGEPFFTEHMYKFLEEFMININDTKRPEQKVLVTVTTNLNFPKHKFDRFMKLVERTPGIIYTTQLSGEAVGKRSEIVRWGLNWETFDKNLDLFYEQATKYDNLHIGYGAAHNCLTVPYLKDYLEYINEKNIKFDYKKNITMHTNWVDFPNHLAVRMTDPKHADAMQEAIDYFANEMSGSFFAKEKYISTLNTLKSHIEMEVSDDAKRNAYEQFSILEKRRKFSFIDYYPHYNELIIKDE